MKGGKVEPDKVFFIKFKDEIKLNHENVRALNPEPIKSIKFRKKYNPEGSSLRCFAAHACSPDGLLPCLLYTYPSPRD